MNTNTCWKVSALAIAIAFWACSGDSSTSSSEEETPMSSSEVESPMSSSEVETPMSSSDAVDDSPNPPEPESSAAVEVGLGRFSLVCKDNSFSAEPPATNEARFYNENGQDFLKIEGLAGPCIETASYSMSRAGDTLLVELGDDIDLTNCFCISDHVFKVEKEDTDAKFVKYVKNESAFFLDYSQYADEVFQVWQSPDVEIVKVDVDEEVPDIDIDTSFSLSPAVEPGMEAKLGELVKVNEYGFAIGECGSDQALFAPKASSETFTADVKQPKAYLFTDGDGHYQVMLPEASDYCDVKAKVSFKRDGDTLYIDYVFDENAIMSKCRCMSDHWFNIDAAYVDVKYVVFEGTTYIVAVK